MKKLTIILLSSTFIFSVNANSAEYIDPNLLRPNLTPGDLSVGDINRTRQYYDSLENFSRRPKMEEPKDIVIDDDFILPPRTMKNAPEIHIKKVEISDSQIFSPSEISKIKSLVEGKNITAEDLNNLIIMINSQYIKKNILTAKAYLPAEALKDGVLKIELIEAKLGKVEIEDNKYTRDFFIKAFLTQKEGDVLDIVTIENNLRQFNQNARGVVLRAKLKPGEQEGTTDVVILADEEFPVRLSGSMDNFGSRSTGEQRVGAILSSDSVIGFQDRFSGAGNWSASSWSAYTDYNVPLNTQDTRLGISYMFGDSDISKGPYRDFKINSRTHTASLYLSHPFIRNERSSLNGVTALNYKITKSNIQDFTYSRMDDANWTLGFNYQHKWDDAFIYTSHTLTNGYIEDKMLDHTQYFFKYNADLYGVKYYDSGIALTGKLSGQYVAQDTPFIEQGQVGGMSTVRGYDESLLMGHSSFVASVEALFPIPFLPKEDKKLFSYKAATGEDKDYYYNFRNNIKWAAFVDTGGVYRHGYTSTGRDYITGIGTGFRISLAKNIQARLYWAYAVSHDRLDVPDNRFHFDLIAAAF